MTTCEIKTAELSWNEQNHPHSDRFDDHYYSLVDGLEESRHVFIQGNDLISRWGSLEKHQTFHIMETGFGSGLNFLATWQLWNNSGISNTNKLHFTSVEAYPLDLQQLSKSLANWELSLSGLTAQLKSKYPPLIKGQHEINFEQNNVTLTLIFTDIRELLPKFSLNQNNLIDAWFLDGFAPSKNPEMWQNDLYQHMYRLSHKDTTVATYTVAGIVRRGLADAGYVIKRKAGFGTKRDMLTAYID